MGLVNTDEYYHISELKNGNRESFKWLFDRYKVTLYSYILSFLKSEKWVDDICSEVFIAVWINRQNIRAETFQSYLFQIAKNKIFNQLKKIAADSRQEEEFVRRYNVSQNWEEENELFQINQLDLLKMEIEKMPPKRKEIIQRKYFYGQKNTQIARDMGITIHTVKVQLYKARHFLKSRVRGEDNSV